MSNAGDLQVDNNMVMTKLMDPAPTSRRERTVRFSPAGNAMVDQVLYPPGDAANFEGLTTAEKRNAVQMNFRTLDFNPTPFSVSGLNVAPDPNCDSIGYLIVNGMRNFAIGLAKNSSTGTWDINYSDVIQNATFNPNDTAGINKFSQTYKSFTFYSNTTAFNNVGSTTCAQFRPAMIFAGSFTEITKLPDWKALARRFIEVNANYITREHDNFDDVLVNHSRLPNELRSYLTELAGEFSKNKGKTYIADFPPDATLQVLDLGVQEALMPSTTELVQSSTKAYNGRATDGCWTRSRACALDPQSVKCFNLYHSAAAGLYQCWHRSITPSGTTYYNSFTEPVSATTAVASLTPLMDTQWDDNFNFTWVQFDGMFGNLNLNGAQPVGLAATILRKGCVGFEVQPSMTSPFAALVKPSPRPDFAAMQYLSEALYDVPDGEPAKNNVLAQIGAAVGRALIRKAAPKVLNAVAARPRLARAVNTAASVVGTVRNAANQAVARANTVSQREETDRARIVRLEQAMSQVAVQLSKMNMLPPIVRNNRRRQPPPPPPRRRQQRRQ